MPLTEKKPLSSNAIKLSAIAAMTVDHIAWAVFPGYPKEFLPLLMHLIGRITCPIMCYCIAEGYHYTRNIRKYTARLFVFALISHFCYIYFSHDFIDWHSFIPFYYGGALNQTSVIRMRSPVRIWVTAPKKPVILRITGFLFLFKIAKARWQ